MAQNTFRNTWNRYRSVSIAYRIGAAFVLGSIVGLTVGGPATVLEPLGDLFIRLLEMLVIPIVVFTLLMGIRQLSPATLGRVGGQVVLLYAFTSAVAVVIGLAVANLVDPGTGLTLTDEPVEAESPPSPTEVFLGIVPENPVDAMANTDLLATLFFVIVFGLALVLVAEEIDDGAVERGIETIFDITEAGSEAMFKVVWGVMEYGVIGVFALMAVVFADTGPGAIRAFVTLILALTLAVALHIAVIHLGVLIVALTHQSPIAFLIGIKEALVTALALASSSATLPVSMANAEDNLRINEGVYGFSLPLGATVNMDGTAMYQGIAAVFAANLVGASLTLTEQFVVVVLAVLASIGAAGVPSAGLIMLTLVLTQLGLPLAVIGFVAGVDPLLDRMRTMTNISGDLAVATVVGHWNGAVDFGSGIWDGAVTEAPASAGVSD
ncbi:dicarboxylate/amino acid:cation symporter [Natronococcus wangiae]|uniref:dicarboxylate/amino acid:cation symporter n=1 Tax=Natronococcus wangiae TaxID=3068275 RepID=UPI00273E9C30|nr:dicarboxylate/amino acid:cation symporter [Natronococcus sp. AD5]